MTSNSIIYGTKNNRRLLRVAYIDALSKSVCMRREKEARKRDIVKRYFEAYYKRINA